MHQTRTKTVTLSQGIGHDRIQVGRDLLYANRPGRLRVRNAVTPCQCPHIHAHHSIYHIHWHCCLYCQRRSPQRRPSLIPYQAVPVRPKPPLLCRYPAVRALAPPGVLGRCRRDAVLSCDSNLWSSDHLVERVSNMREDWLSVKGFMSVCAAAVVGGFLSLMRLLCFAREVRTP